MGAMWLASIILLLLPLIVHPFNIVIRKPPADIIQPVIKRFPPPDSALYKKKEYILKIFDWMVYEHELQPRERLLEYGSGALSSGIWFIEYLQPGNYYGMEAVKWLYDAGVEYEVPLHMLEDKHPNLLHNPEEELEPAVFNGATLQRILALTAFHHLVHDPALVERTLRGFLGLLAPGGTVYVAGELPLPEDKLRHIGLAVTRSATFKCRYIACDFDVYELQDVNQAS